MFSNRLRNYLLVLLEALGHDGVLALANIVGALLQLLRHIGLLCGLTLRPVGWVVGVCLVLGWKGG